MKAAGAKENAAEAMGNAAIVLVQPKRAENIGSVARIAANMGINRLILVRREMPDQEIMRRVATHHAGRIIDTIELFPRLAEALASFQWVVGTSARQGRQRHSQVSPQRMVADALPKLAGNKLALVFGPEDRGLTNEDLSLCNAVTCIPTADFSSLNLSQAVALVSYELFSGVLQSRDVQKGMVAKLADVNDLEVMYGQIEKALRKMDFLKETDYAYWMHNLRHFLGRIGLRAREAKFVRGFCSQIIKLADKDKK